MSIHFVTDEKIAETSSKGNQEKWFDAALNEWYKLYQFGYEELSEAVISRLLEKSNIETDTPFKFVRYDVKKVNVHKHERIVCSSVNFLRDGQSIITLSHLFSRIINVPLKICWNVLQATKKNCLYC